MRSYAKLMIALAFPLVSFHIAVAQDRQDQPFKISVTTRLVVENVSVKDRSGNAVEGLTEKDFTVTEDGVPQTISLFRFEKLDDTPVPPLERIVVPDLTAEPAASLRPAVNLARYQNRRLLVLFFDPGGFNTYSAAAKFIQSQMKAADMVAIMRFQPQKGVVRILQDFTDDRDALMSMLWKLAYTDEFDDYGPDITFGQDTPEFNLFNTDARLSALVRAAALVPLQRV